jgi:hypothetical protein
MFVQAESCIQLSPGGVRVKDQHWYCDILAVNFRAQSVYLCEVTFSKTLSALMTRLRQWDSHWLEICGALSNDNRIPDGWGVRPWVFVPAAQRGLVSWKMTALLDPDTGPHPMPRPLATSLEDVAPWQGKWPRELPGPSESDA